MVKKNEVDAMAYKKRINKQLLPYLYEHVKKKVDLAEFLESDIGCNLNWYEENVSAGTTCPMPHHSETKPSFRIKYVEEDSVWIFHCLGCGSKGTIIDFCMEYYGLHNSAEAVVFICNKFGFKNSIDLVTDSLKDVKKKVNLQKKMECANIVSSNQCRVLLKKNYNRYNKWVADAYARLNRALDEGDIDVIEGIGFEASNKMREEQ